ncbi:MAG: V-type ATP synthase subunit F [Clostridiales bacterium]|jgi:V/A-type H+-transporting ATPase subunit F|nr:V-type ATP synthase subunit F [Clostridiales bacterium]
MKMYVISDNTDTVVGMRLVGIEGCNIGLNDSEKLRQELLNAKNRQDLGVLLITEKLSKQFPDIIKEMRLSSPLPLLVEIPDRHGTERPADFITKYVKEAIGVRL